MTNNTELVLYKIDGSGHTKPSLVERYSDIYLTITGGQNGDIKMANELWDFFKDKVK